jgi:hypothetical protein
MKIILIYPVIKFRCLLDFFSPGDIHALTSNNISHRDHDRVKETISIPILEVLKVHAGIDQMYFHYLCPF